MRVKCSLGQAHPEKKHTEYIKEYSCGVLAFEACRRRDAEIVVTNIKYKARGVPIVETQSSRDSSR